jgi:hypothetical protein
MQQRAGDAWEAVRLPSCWRPCSSSSAAGVCMADAWGWGAHLTPGMWAPG